VLKEKLLQVIHVSFFYQSDAIPISLALVGHAPQYIVDLIWPVADLPSWASLRTAFSGDLYVPRTRRRFGDRAFAVAAPCVWNSLPTDIKLHRSMTTSFKRRLKTVLLTGASLNICNDSVMCFQSFSRKRNINTLVTVTVTVVSQHWIKHKHWLQLGKFTHWPRFYCDTLCSRKWRHQTFGS